MAHRSALLSCSPTTDFSPAVPLDLATAPGCGLLLYLIVSLHTDNIDIVKLSGLETSEETKTLQEGNMGLP